MAAYRSMELDDEAKSDLAVPGVWQPNYPPGLRICLTESELKRLEVDPSDQPDINDLMHFSCFAKVTHFSKGDGAGGDGRRIEMQITAIRHIEDEDHEGDDD